VTNEEQIEWLQAEALYYNKWEQWRKLRNTIRKLEKLWFDDHAAKRFYARMEQENSR